MNSREGWKRFQRVAWFVVVGLLVVWSIPGCGTQGTVTDIDNLLDEEGAGGSELAQIEGQVVIDGSSTVAPISEAAAEAFERKFTNVKVTVATSGTGGGFKRFTKGETDISDASPAPSPSDPKCC